MNLETHILRLDLLEAEVRNAVVVAVVRQDRQLEDGLAAWKGGREN